MIKREDYLPNTAGKKMITEIITAKPDDSIKNVLDKLRLIAKKLNNVDYIYINDNNGLLVGVASIKELFLQPKNKKLKEIMNTKVVHISPNTELEKAANVAFMHSIKAVPVVENGKLLGILNAHEVHYILNKALKEDILHFAGIHKSHLEYENTLEVPLLKTVEHRIPWLIIGFIGILITAGIINIFESILNKYIILAFFIPAIVYMSSALGTQHQTLFIRDLAVMGKELKIGLYFSRQMFISLIIGSAIGLLTFLAVSMIWKQQFIAFVIALSIFIAIIITSFTSLVVTIIIKKFKMDPALGSGPFATVVSDLTSIVIYFLIAMLLL